MFYFCVAVYIGYFTFFLQIVSSAVDALITSQKYFLVPGLSKSKAFQGTIVTFFSNSDEY